MLVADQSPTRRWVVAPHGRASCPARAPFAYATWRRRVSRAFPVCQVGGSEFSAPEGLQPPRVAKLRPFNPQTQLREDVLAFQQIVPVGEGEELVMMTLQERWIKDAADILTDSFAESMGYRSVYKNFLRHQILQYLQNHVDLPPKSVVLVALLRDTAGPGSAGPAGWEQETEAAGDFWSSSSSSSQNGSSRGGGSWECGSSWAGKQWNEDVRAGSVPSSPFSTTDAGAAAAGSFSLRSGSWDGIGSPGDASQSSSEALPGEGPDPSGEDDGKDGRVVGVVEVSFTPSTRSKFLTLNPPTDRPFLSNMCVAVECRGRGFGKAIMAAAEKLVVLTGDSEIWLHVRVQDEAAARLYEAAGFHEVQRDTILLSVIGMDRRRLMRKRLRQP